VLDRSPRLAHVFLGYAQIAERGALAPPVANFAQKRKGLLVVLDRPPRLAKSGMGQTQVAKRVALAQSVPELPAGRELR
jgi:hypothetical protein